MFVRRIASVVALLCCLFSVAAVHAADTPQAVLDRFIEATGGRAAYEGLKSRRSTSTWNVGGMELKATLLQSQTAAKLTITMPGTTEIQGVFNDVAYYSGMMGPRLLDGQEAEAMLEMTNFVPNFDMYSKVEVAGTEQIDGKDAVVLNLVSNAGSPEKRFYDAQTGLLIRLERTAMTAMGEITTVMTIDGYKDFDGVKEASLTTVQQGPQTFTIRVDSIEQNAQIADTDLAPPAEIIELMKP